jgi:hypothetical protein
MSRDYSFLKLLFCFGGAPFSIYEKGGKKDTFYP